MRRLAAAALAAVLVAGCGQSDADKAEGVVREFVQAANERDADRLCGDLVSDAFVRETTFATGDHAREACREQLQVLHRPPIDLVAIQGVRVQGDRATVLTELEIGGERRREVFELVKEGGDFRLNSGTAGT